ncbi:MAG: EAL domain-containing protein [Burkholderiales bacterium]|nr:EAL domain-containing protein [Burkholderiales bacterium]
MRATHEQQLFDDVCAILTGPGGYFACWIGIAEPDAGRTIQPVAFGGEAGRFIAAQRFSYAEDDPSPAGNAMRTGRPQRIANILSAPAPLRFRESLIECGVRSLLVLPLWSNAATAGVLSVSATQRRAFDPEETAQLERLAEDIGYGMATLRARALRERADQLQNLEHAIGRCLAQSLDARTALVAVIRNLCESENWECGRYFAVDESAGLLRVAEAWSIPEPRLLQFIESSRALRVARGEGILGEVWQSGQAQWVPDILAHLATRALRDSAFDAGIRAAFVFPVTAGERIAGVMSFSCRSVRAPDLRLQKAVASIGSQLGQYLQRLTAQADLRRFRAAMDLSLDIIILVQLPTLRVVDVNRTGVEQLGYSRDELLAMGSHQLSRRTHEEQAQVYRAVIEGRVQENSREGLHFRKDGSSFPVEVYRRHVRAPDGEFVVVILRDISARLRAERLQNLEHAVASRLAGAESAVQALRAVIQAVCETEDWDCGRYLQVDESAGVLRFVEFWAKPGAPIEAFIERSRRRVLAPGESVAGRAWETGQAIWMADIDAAPGVRRSDAEQRARMRGAFVFPVTSAGRVIGVLAFHSLEIREPDERLRKAVLAIGSQIGQFLARQLAEERSRVQAQHQRLIAEFSQQALAATEIVAVLRQAVELARGALAVDCCDISRFERESRRVTCMASSGWPRDWPGFAGVPVSPGGPLERALSRHEPVVVENYADPSHAGRSLLAHWGIQSGVQMPIRSAEGTFGVLGVHSARRRAFTPEEVDFLHSLAGVLAVALERTQAADRLAYFAQFDSLTGLPNRHLFHDRLMRAMAQAKRSGGLMAVLFIDLDRFKVINDTLGHTAGDLLLKQTAQRLLRCVRENDTAGRLGGDEFSAVLMDLAQPGDAGTVAQKIIEAMVAPFDLDGHESYVSASVGIALYPADGDEAGTLLMNADAAMYRAKEQGRNNFQFFTREMNERSLRRAQMESRLRRALAREEFLLEYQPRVDLATGEVCGLEALLRWNQPGVGLTGPAAFIPVLEETNLILPVGEWVLRQTCCQIRAWRDGGVKVPPVAVNLSARQFQQKDLDVVLTRILHETGTEPGQVQFEITESLLMNDPDGAARVLQALSAAGIKLSVDDFGIGYSSLAYLKRFPLDVLKVDRTFVHDIASDPENAAITLAIINLAHTLGMRVIAEGIETQGQIDFLSGHGCDEMQGFFFARPMPPADCLALLRDGRRLDLAEPQPGRPAVLVVDDSPADLELLKAQLDTGDFPLLGATDTRHAYELLARHRVAVVVCDQRMPGMSGAQFLQSVQRLYPSAVRIAITGSSDPQTLLDAVNTAAVHKFLSKAWDAERLRAEIRASYDSFRSDGQAQR